MSYKESQIAFETPTHWVLAEKGLFTVFKNTATHSVSDSAYDNLGLAICRAAYLSGAPMKARDAETLAAAYLS
ncbi:MAG: hypothetical protein IH622_13610 [Ochrobactrum anthropi]|uniref:Uncharacterized protein n=1 Tax=Brucella anthropi TaxID=529 RepID=A0A8I0N6T0_BRUAN|nr:hypothetical protein [Brucella anthropi]MBE0561834.1 hypothetical protein [Brucella anthropi]